MAHRTGSIIIAGMLSAFCFLSAGSAAFAAASAVPGMPAQPGANVTGPNGAPQSVPDKTAAPLTILVADEARVLGPAGLSHLKSAAAEAASGTGVRFYIYIVRSMNGQLGESVVAKKAAAENLSTGRDSIVMLISVRERQGWLWTSPGLDQTMGEGVKQAVLDYIIEPNLERGDIMRAASDGTRALSMAVEGAYKNPRIEVAPAAPVIPGIPDGALPGVLLAAFVAMLGGGGVYGAARGLGGGVGGGAIARQGPNILSRLV